MKFKIYVSLLLAITIVLFEPVKAQTKARAYNVNRDSLLLQLPLQKTAKDSIRVLEQLVDANFEPDNKGYLSRLLELNKREKVINASPYQLLQKAADYYKNKQFSQALNAYELAVNEFDKQHKVITYLLMDIRGQFNQLNDQEGKLRYYQQKLEYYQLNGPVENTAPCYHALGGYYHSQAAYNQSINYYLKAAEIARNFFLGFYVNELAVVGNVYGIWGNDEKAGYYLKKSLPIFLKLKDSSGLSFANYSLGQLSFKNKSYNKALDQLNKSISNCPKNDSGIYATLVVAKAITYIELNNAGLAYPLLIKAKSIVDSLKLSITNPLGNLESDYGFYEYYRHINKFAEAEKYLLVAYNKSKEAHSTELQLKYLKELGDFYQSRQKPNLAVNYFNQCFNLQDQVEKAQDKFKVAQYETDQKDRQQQEHISQLKQDGVLQAYQLKRRNVLLGFTLLIVLLVSGLLILIYKQLQANKKILAALRLTQKQLIQSEKMASMGELTAGIAHEIQNPLNFVNNFSEVSIELLDEMEEEMEKGDVKEASAIAADVKQNLEKIRHHGKRADGIVKGMLQHSRNGSGERQPTDVNVLADEYLRLSYHGLRAKDKSFNAALTTHFQENLPKVNIVPQDIGRVLLNLFNNAFYAVQQKQKTSGADYKPEVTVDTSFTGTFLVIKVKDNGTGIPDAVKDKIMQPFFTTKPTGEGTGLGLSLSYDIVVKGHGGKLDIVSEEGKGSEFIIGLPIK